MSTSELTSVGPEAVPANRARSLRAQLSMASAAGVFVLSIVSAVLVGVAQWQEENNSLISAVELEAFQMAEIDELSALAVGSIGGRGGFSVALGSSSELRAEVGVVTDEVLLLSEEIWQGTIEQDLVYSTVFELEDGSEMVTAGVACVDSGVCDSVVVGRSPTPLIQFLLARVIWLLTPCLVVSALAFFGARWMVGRALQPVEAMRSELASITASSLDRRVPQPRTGDELERLADTFNHTLSRLQTSAEATQRFAADAAHELRSPITGVRAAVELRAGNDELLGQALDELDRANRLIDDLLILAKRQQVAPRREDIDLDDLIRSDLLVARTRFPEVAFSEQLVPAKVNGDGDALRRVVGNVIDNAANHCKSTVSVELQQVPGGHRIQVDDDGPGIPPSERARVFERFARLDSSRSRATGGTGLGLALVAELVADHGGSVSVETADLGGARFLIDLPGRR